jgi:RNA polymerase sigma-70 factor (ECF subfamily)
MPSSSGAERDGSHDYQTGASRRDQKPSREFSRTSTSLLEAIRSLDAMGWRRFVETYEARVYRWCRRAGLDENDAADIAQKVFVAVSHKINSFHRDRPGDSFHKWVRAITTHKIQDYWRAQGREEQSPGGSAWLVRMHELPERCDPSSTVLIQPIDPDDPRVVAIQRVRAEFKPRDWCLFERTVVDEQAPADVAEEFGVSVNVVYLAKSRILQRVRACFAEDGEG